MLRQLYFTRILRYVPLSYELRSLHVHGLHWLKSVVRSTPRNVDRDHATATVISVDEPQQRKYLTSHYATIVYIYAAIRFMYMYM